MFRHITIFFIAKPLPMYIGNQAEKPGPLLRKAPSFHSIHGARQTASKRKEAKPLGLEGKEEANLRRTQTDFCR